jgi:hypothetical protein
VELTRLGQDIAALDKVLLMLDPDYRPGAGHANRRGPSGGNPFSHGEMSAAALRGMGRPTTSAECARSMLEAKGRADDELLQAQNASRVAAVFSQKASAGQLRRVGNGDGRQVLWQIER